MRRRIEEYYVKTIEEVNGLSREYEEGVIEGEPLNVVWGKLLVCCLEWK